MSKYLPNALRSMALQVIEAWQSDDPLFRDFMRALQKRTGLSITDAQRLLTRLAGY